VKKLLSIVFLLYLFLFIYGSVFAVGERTIFLGGAASWNSAETRTGISETGNIRPHSVLLLTSVPPVISGYSAVSGAYGNFSALPSPALDMSVSFDEKEAPLFRDSAGMYRVKASEYAERVDSSLARGGVGAALFGRSEPLVIEPQNRNALFAPGRRIGDFTVEFWLYPFNSENGEKIFSWVSFLTVNGNIITQKIQCAASRNRMQWSFVNFFAEPGFGINGNSSFINLEFSGSSPVVPKRWSHHLVRFDAKTGMIEYLVNGSSEAISYATGTRRESSEVYTPLTGADGSFLLGESYTGLIDELKIHSVFAGRSTIQKYASSGGRIETKAIDLGDDASSIVRLDVTGGRTGIIRNSVINEFRENGRFRFSDETQLNFFIRSSENPWLLNAKTWVNFTPGEEVGNIQGRYVQIAVDFYPSADGEASPYLEQIKIIYIPGEPPLPPRNLTAVAFDGSVRLSWKPGPDINTDGYLVYYSSVRGDLFGEGSALGASPIDAGKAGSILINGLQNGTLYYFRIAGYSRAANTGKISAGEFSAEVTARPVKQ